MLSLLRWCQPTTFGQTTAETGKVDHSPLAGLLAASGRHQYAQMWHTMGGLRFHLWQYSFMPSVYEVLQLQDHLGMTESLIGVKDCSHIQTN